MKNRDGTPPRKTAFLSSARGNRAARRNPRHPPQNTPATENPRRPQKPAQRAAARQAPDWDKKPTQQSKNGQRQNRTQNTFKNKPLQTPMSQTTGG